MLPHPPFYGTCSEVGLDPKVMTAYHCRSVLSEPVTCGGTLLSLNKGPDGLAVLTVLWSWRRLRSLHYLRASVGGGREGAAVPDSLLPLIPIGTVDRAHRRPRTALGQGAAAQPTRRGAQGPGTCRPKYGRRRERPSAPPRRPQGNARPPVVAAVPPPPPPPVMMNLPGPGQAQAAQPPASAELPRVATQQQPQPPQQAAAPAPAVEEAARPPAAEPASLPVRADTTVRVRSNSWIELRAPNGDVLAQTYVRAGESYVVPAGIAYRIVDAR